MPIRTSYAQGTPNWVDLQTSNQDAAKAFYAGLSVGRMAVISDPQGAVFSIIRLAAQPS
ncbi:MAG: VOC family protein [Streptosporangiaceae bacterium]